MKKISVLLMCSFLLVGCSSYAYDEYKEENPNAGLGDYGKFKIVDTVEISTSHNKNFVEISQDPKTGCMYIVDSTDNNPLTVSPLFDENGQVQGCGEIREGE